MPQHLAHSITHILTKTHDEWITVTYVLGKKITKYGHTYTVTEIRVTDSFGVFHAEIELDQDFGFIWIQNITEILFIYAERGILQDHESGDTEDEDPLWEQQGSDTDA